MIDISGHLRPIKKEIGYEDSSHELVVNCCGFQSFSTIDFSRRRPEGRLDYQIIYIHKGFGEFYINQKFKKIDSGNIVIYRPGVPQIYNYYAQDKPEIYWIHFTGSRAQGFMNQFGLDETCVKHIGRSKTLVSIFDKIIYELQLKPKNYEYMTYSYLFNMVTSISRLAEEIRTDKNIIQKNFIQKSIQYIHSNYSRKITVEALASFAHLSKYRFIHVFKERVGMAPIEYLAFVRIEKAKELLNDSSLSIKQVSDFLGYSSPFYFSRIFKKHAGMAPSVYAGSKINF